MLWASGAAALEGHHSASPTLQESVSYARFLFLAGISYQPHFPYGYQGLFIYSRVPLEQPAGGGMVQKS
jgi:hypothetical protein